jgi:hypothetical protein
MGRSLDQNFERKNWASIARDPVQNAVYSVKNYDKSAKELFNAQYA